MYVLGTHGVDYHVPAEFDRDGKESIEESQSEKKGGDVHIMA